jgi:hypothetical protein
MLCPLNRLIRNMGISDHFLNKRFKEIAANTAVPVTVPAGVCVVFQVNRTFFALHIFGESRIRRYLQSLSF